MSLGIEGFRIPRGTTLPREKDLPCARCGTLMWRGATSLPAGQATCHPCRAQRRTECAAQAPLRKVALPRTCVVCSAAFRSTYRPKPGRPTQVTCSRECGVALRRSRGNLGPRHLGLPKGTPQPLAINTCRRCRAPFLWLATKLYCPTCPPLDRRVPPPTEKACQECAQKFTASSARRYCSRPCASRAERRQRRKADGRFVVSTAARLYVYERDSHTCHLCLHPVRTDVAHDHPWSATLDHLVPRSQRGSDDHTNLACAHRWCNTLRSDHDLAATRVALRNRQPADQWDTRLFASAVNLIGRTRPAA